jgi:hypothetical protein
MVLVILIAMIACLALALTAIYRRILSGGARLPVTAEWIDELSVDRYQPMKRLLAEDDLKQCRSRADYTPELAAEFRRERCRIFRGYLRCLQTDFQRVSMALRIVMVQSRYDRPDLASALVRSQRHFAFGLALVHCRLVLYQFGLAGVDVADLLKVFDTARLELRSLVPAQMGAAA